MKRGKKASRLHLKNTKLFMTLVGKGKVVTFSSVQTARITNTPFSFFFYHSTPAKLNAQSAEAEQKETRNQNKTRHHHHQQQRSSSSSDSTSWLNFLHDTCVGTATHGWGGPVTRQQHNYLYPHQHHHHHRRRSRTRTGPRKGCPGFGRKISQTPPKKKKETQTGKKKGGVHNALVSVGAGSP